MPSPESGAMSPLLEADDLKVTYGSVAAVRGVSFELRDGEVLGIVGESGSGKSSLAKAVLGLTSISGGSVRIEGVPLQSVPVLALRRFMQPVFQDPGSALDPRFTVGQAIAEPLVIHGFSQREARVQRLLADVALSGDLALRKPHELSAGQRQRVNLARALALEPRVLVLDEPVSALDVSVQAHVLNLLMALKRERQLALIFISHAIDVVAHIADRVAVMHQGLLVEQGATEALLGAPAHASTRQLLRDAHQLVR